jgi:asparagine synthase (glutamine-hydrolysing)
VLTVWDAKNCETAFKDILVLPPAHAIRIKNGIKQIIRYWVMEDTPPLYLKSAKDYIEPYLFHIRQSVENRMRSIGPVATQLSSGFDSSTVTAFAAQKYMREGKRLTTFTSVPFYDSATLFSNRIATDESYLTIPTCKFLGNADNYIVSSQHTSILNSLLLSLEMHNVPLHAAGNMYWIYDIYELAHQQGIRTLLNGQLGNATISWRGYSVYNELKKWIRQTLLLQHPQWKERAKLANLVLSKRQWPDSDALPNPWDSYSVISRQFGKDIQLKDQMRQTGHDPYFTSNFHFKQIRLQFLNPTQSRAGMIWQNIGHHYGIDTFDPTNDRRLTAFCWSVPNNIYFREGEYKWLIKHAMQGVLPDSLIHQTRKGRQATDISFRIQKEGVAFQDLLDSFKKEAAIGYYLDIPKMEQLLNEIRLRPDQVSAYGNSIFLLRGIQTGLFIRKYIN